MKEHVSIGPEPEQKFPVHMQSQLPASTRESTIQTRNINNKHDITIIDFAMAAPWYFYYEFKVNFKCLQGFGVHFVLKPG
jgi:hypothetical protein